MILIGSVPKIFTNEEIKKYRAEHIWTIPAEKVIANRKHRRKSVNPKTGTPNRYRAEIQVNPNEPKRTVEVVYTTGSTPNPINSMHLLELPIQIYIEKGVRRCTDHELNWFWDHAPWAEGTIGYKPSVKRIINLFKREKIAINKQAKAEVMVRLVERIQKMSDIEIISAGKIVTTLNTQKAFINFNEQRLETEETREEELMCLRADLVEMAAKEPHLLGGVLMRKESKIIQDVHKAMEDKRLIFNRENIAPGTQGTWILKNGNKNINIYTVTDMERPDDGLISFLIKPTSHHFVLMIQGMSVNEENIVEKANPNVFADEGERLKLIEEAKKLKEEGFLDKIQGFQNMGIDKLRIKISEARIKKEKAFVTA